MTARPMDCRAVSLDSELADYELRVGDMVQAPEGGWGRVVLVFGPRVVIARPPRWHDHLWLWLVRIIDRCRLGPRGSR